MNSNDRHFLGLQRWQDAKRTNEQGLSGFSYNPIIARPLANQYEFLQYIQETMPVPSGTPYFYGWQGVENNNTRIWDFDLLAPPFTLPSGKTVALDTQTDTRDNEAMLQRGVTYATNSSKQTAFIGDKVFTDLGCPPAGDAGNPTGFNNWINSVDGNQLIAAVANAVAPHVNKELILINGECIDQSGSTNREHPKILAIFDWYNSQNYNAKISIWNVSPKKISRINYENGIRQITTEYPTLSQKLDFCYVGGYINFPTNHGVIHHMVDEFLANKSATPNIKYLLTGWHDCEFVSNGFNLRPCSPKGRAVNQSGTDAADYIWFNKAGVFNQVMFNWGVWAVAILDGLYLWSDDKKFTDNVSHHPFKAEKNGTLLPTVDGVMYARNNMKNVNWLIRGVYEVCKPDAKAIIEAAGDFIFPNDIFDSLTNRKPLIAHKKHNGKVLILCYCWYSLESQIITTAVTIEGVTYNAKSYGTWTGVNVF